MPKQLQFVCPHCGANLDLEDTIYAECYSGEFHIESCQECAEPVVYGTKFTVEELIAEIPFLSVKYN